MQQSTFSRTEQRTCQSSGKGAVTKDLRQISKRARLASEPSTPENEPFQKSSRLAPALPGSLIHISQSADGKLRWNPPASSTSSSNESRAFSACFSAADCGPVSIVSPALIRTEWARTVTASKKSLPTESRKHETSEAGPASPSLTSRCNHITSDSSIICSADTAQVSDVQAVTYGSHQSAPSSSELSTSLQQRETGGKKALAGARDSSSFRSSGLSPYPSSKLKPGKHILGVRKHQNYIRPGQLRHWAVGNSPSLNLANLPATSSKGKACRTLAF